MFFVGGIERTLESSGNVGQDTSVVIDPATGFGLIGYYDVDNGDMRLPLCHGDLRFRQFGIGQRDQ